eukprot:jgi/Mesvir1/17261/Mv07669-RA.1
MADVIKSLEVDMGIDVDGCGADTSFLKIIDAFACPKVVYDASRRSFRVSAAPSRIHADAPAKAALYRERFLWLQQSVLRNRLFQRPALAVGGARAQHDYFELRAIQTLRSDPDPFGIKVLMGTLTQLEDGKFFLEDVTGTLPVELAGAVVADGFFTENCIVIALGEVVPNTGGTFRVKELYFPPVEPHKEALLAAKGLDMFGGGTMSGEERAKLEALEQTAFADQFVILSDVWLDEPETMAKLQVLFEGFQGVPAVPSLFVFMGNFMRQQGYRVQGISHEAAIRLRFHLQQLAEMLARFPRLCESSRFLFIPGPCDPAPVSALPQPALSDYFTAALKERVPSAAFGSNPCRVRWYSREMVFFRYALLNKMSRSALVQTNITETTPPFCHMVTTVLQEAHLCPLPLTSQPVLWDYDHALRLYPSPHTLVLGDACELQETSVDGCKAFTPGMFSRDGSFVVYQPSFQKVDVSRV